MTSYHKILYEFGHELINVYYKYKELFDLIDKNPDFKDRPLALLTTSNHSYLLNLIRVEEKD